MGHSQARKTSHSTRDISSCDYSMPRFPIAIRINWSPLAREIIKDHNPWIPPTSRRLPGGTLVFLLNSPTSSCLYFSAIRN